MPWGKTNYQRFFPSLTWQVEPQIPRVLAECGEGARIVDLGAGGRKISPRTVCVDFLPLSNTDLVADVQRLPLRDDSVDAVVATGLFEHVEDERALIAEIHRVLRPGGTAHVEMPFLQQYHDDPIDCRRMTVPGLALVMEREGFETVRRGVHIGPTVTLVTLGAYYVALLFEGRNVVCKALSTGAFLVASVLAWPLKFLDRFLVGKPSAHRLAFGIYYTGRKR